MNADPKKAPAFRTIEKVEHQNTTWFGKRGDEVVAEFFYESDAVEWRANDPLNRGTIDELLEREEQRKAPTSIAAHIQQQMSRKR